MQMANTNASRDRHDTIKHERQKAQLDPLRQAKPITDFDFTTALQ